MGVTGGAAKVMPMILKKRHSIPLLLALLLGASGPDAGRWWSVYVTVNAGNPLARGKPEAGLVSLVDGAADHVYGAFYQVTAPRVVDALCRARARGVDVKIVTESDTFRMRESPAGRFRDAGVEVACDDGRGLMHNKFAVADGERVWTGSYNPTPKGSGSHDENAILIRSPRLAAIFTEKFMMMFRDGVFANPAGPGPFSGILNRHHVRIDEADINVYFSPEDDVERIILGRLRKARTSIRFMAYSFTSDAVAEMMIRKHREGVDVRGVFERRGAKSPHGEYIKMKIEGIPVMLDRNRHAMHHKVIVIDEVRVITGSYNFSRNAARNNDENVLVIDDPGIAAAYLAEFRRLYR